MIDRDEILTRLKALEAAVGHIVDDPPPDDNDIRLTKPATAKRYAVTTRTIERWQADPSLGFPTPNVIRGRWYFSLAELRAYDRARARAPFQKSARKPQRGRDDA